MVHYRIMIKGGPSLIGLRERKRDINEEWIKE
jgi:hypothetical protein